MRPILLLFGVALALCGCGLLGSGDQPASAPAQAPAPAEADMLRPGDVVRVAVAGEDELSGTFAVSGDGSVRLELLGKVPAAGLSPAAFAQTLKTRLAAGYLTDPQVVVTRATDRPVQTQMAGAPSAPPLRQSVK